MTVEPPTVATATVELAAPVDVSLVTLASGGLGTTVDTSLDGVAWSTLGTASAVGDADLGVTAVAAAQPVAARFVRFDQPEGIVTSEVSVWAPAPGPSSAPRLAAPSEPVRRVLSGPGGLWGWGWRVAAAGLVVTLWFALGCWCITGSTARSRIRSRGAIAFVRHVRGIALRTVAAIGGWPHLLDVVRRVDRWNPAPAPSTLVTVLGAGHLHRYDVDGVPGRPVLLVHSVISGSTVLDLTPDASFVRSLQASGRDVWLLDWEFRHVSPEIGLQHLAWEVVLAVNEIERRTSATAVPVIGYCLGATIALLREAAWPSGAPLALVAPLVAAPEPGATPGMAGVLADRRIHPLLALDERGRVPAALVREAFHWLRPKALRSVRTWSAARAVPELAAGYAAMGRWVWDHQDLPGGVLLDAVDIVRAGGLGAGWSVAGERIDLTTVTGPVLIVCAARDHIVPPEQSRGSSTWPTDRSTSWRSMPATSACSSGSPHPTPSPTSPRGSTGLRQARPVKRYVGPGPWTGHDPSDRPPINKRPDSPACWCRVACLHGDHDGVRDGDRRRRRDLRGVLRRARRVGRGRGSCCSRRSSGSTTTCATWPTGSPRPGSSPLVPDMFWRIEPRFERKDESGMGDAFAMVQRSTSQLGVADIKATHAHLARHARVHREDRRHGVLPRRRRSPSSPPPLQPGRRQGHRCRRLLLRLRHQRPARPRRPAHLPDAVPLRRERPVHPRGQDRRGRAGRRGPSPTSTILRYDAGHAFSNADAPSMYNAEAADTGLGPHARLLRRPPGLTALRWCA